MARWWCGKHYIMFYFASLFLQIYATAIVHLFYTVRKIDVIMGRRNFMKFSKCTRKNKIACIFWLNSKKAEIIQEHHISTAVVWILKIGFYAIFANHTMGIFPKINYPMSKQSFPGRNAGRNKHVYAARRRVWKFM